MSVILIIFGIGLVALAFADLVNTLVTTSTSSWRWWPSHIVGYRAFAIVRAFANRLPEESKIRERVLSAFAPVLVLLLLIVWIGQQILGFALIWHGVDAVSGVDGLVDSIYYSGVVFFTVGFGEVLPTSTGLRMGALAEAGLGVITTALVIGYLPSLYSAYSARETKLITLDDGSDDRITPTNLVMAWSPDADPERLNAQFKEWEQWVAGILETHSTLPLLQLFRSHDRRQNWVTALGLLSDAALHAQLIVGSTGKTESYWFLRRSITLFEAMTEGADLTDYLPDQRSSEVQAENEQFFRELYTTLEAHGFELIPFDEAVIRSQAFRTRYGPQMEYLIDFLLCPRGFWSTDLQLGLDDLVNIPTPVKSE